LGKVDEAQQWLGQALTIAQEHQQPDWESKAYYDIGYIHVHATFDSNRARKAFQQSVEVCSDLSVVPAWRRIEMYQAKALVALLERRIEAAVNAAHEGLWLSKRESLAYYDVKLLNLLGVCKLAAGLYEEARLAFSRSRSVAAMCFNERAFWRALANLGALTALEEGPAQAMDYLSLAEQNLRTRVRGGAFTREVPILANYIVICAQLGQEQRVRQLVSAWPDPRLTKLAHELARTAGGRISSLGLFRQRGLAFCAT
jgi:tetratricopeptide (TPR) repeat protein